MFGKIIRGIAGFYYVYIEEFGEIECKAKGIFRNRKIKPLVGDDVEVVILDSEKKTGNIVDIKERKSELIRPAVANIDQAVVIFAVADPAPNYNLLDRFLVMMERQNIKTIICFNKSDKGSEEEKQQLRDNFKGTGYQVIFTNAKAGEGVDTLKGLLKGKVTVLAGPSGVGKSSLTNQIQDNVMMQTGQISEKIKRGKHTTRHTEFIAMKDHTYLLDTPGFSSLYITDMPEEDLKYYYPEFDEYRDDCRFNGCNHINEPDCKVKEALANDKISRTRYESYCQIFDELKNQKKY
ncbi:MAG: ribosome small subunit-dependent GTPase A [Clostridiales bacterium]|nr:ribosome small subunit-dependent GTPase A [Clostridiales bacterium]